MAYENLTKYLQIMGGPSNLDITYLDYMSKPNLSEDTKGAYTSLKSILSEIDIDLDVLTFREILYCSDYECAIKYYNSLDKLLNDREAFLRYKKSYFDYQNSNVWSNYSKEYGVSTSQGQGISAIHIPHSEDKLNSDMGFPRGAKTRTAIFYSTVSDDGNSNPLMAPGSAAGTTTIGIVYGESSINSSQEKPKIINGFEQRQYLNRSRVNSSGDGSELEFIKSFIENSLSSEIEMEYLYHEGQTIVNNKPVVTFDGKYIVVDAIETDIIEDTYLWYVIKNVAGTNINLSIQIFIANCEPDYPSINSVSLVSELFGNPTLPENISLKNSFTTNYNLFFNKVGDFFIEANKETPNCTLLQTLVGEISPIENDLSTSYSNWKNNSITPSSSYLFSELTTILNNLKSEIYSYGNEKVAILENFECFSKDKRLMEGSKCGNLGGYSSFGGNDSSFYTIGDNISSTLSVIRTDDNLLSVKYASNTFESKDKQTATDIMKFYYKKRNEIVDEIIKSGLKYNAAKKLLAFMSDSILFCDPNSGQMLNASRLDSIRDELICS